MNDEVKPMTTRRKDRKPKCPWKPPFKTRDDGEFYYLEVSGAEQGTESLLVNNNYPDEKARLDAYCYALNLAYPVVRKGKGAHK